VNSWRRNLDRIPQSIDASRLHRQRRRPGISVLPCTRTRHTCTGYRLAVRAVVCAFRAKICIH